MPGILAHCRWPVGTNPVEGVNSNGRVIKRIACDLSPRWLLLPQYPGRLSRSWETSLSYCPLPPASYSLVPVPFSISQTHAPNITATAAIMIANEKPTSTSEWPRKPKRNALTM